MSQSPESAGAPTDQVRRYKRGWQAFSRMIAEGRSFSGHERNCCFLNMGGGEFADVSAATELDFLDDSRAVAVVDWDFDGRLDFWVTNRTAPRIRFLRNETRNDCHFVAVRLQGVTCNRDAIGARVELHLEDLEQNASAPRRQFIKQVIAGDGYLSQSSKWIHFGIAPGERIDRLVVHWPDPNQTPGSRKETFRGLRVDRHYDLVQGAAVATLWTPPATAPRGLQPKLEPPPNDALQRTVIVSKVLLPRAEYRDRQGNQVPLTNHLGKPLLVNLWSPTCAPCLAELSEWTTAAAQLRAEQLDIVAISVDALLDSGATQSARANQVLDEIGFPWSSGIARPRLVQTLEMMHQTYVQRQQDLPLPSSFLLDREGRLAVIYKGPLPVDTLLDDLAVLEANAELRRASAVPYPGRWGFAPFAADPVRIVKKLDTMGRTGDATDYARRSIAGLESAAMPASVNTNETRIELHDALGDLLLKQGYRPQARVVFTRMLNLGNHAARLHRDIGESYMAHNLPIEALSHLASALPGEPDDADLLYNLGIAELAAGKPSSASEHLRRSHTLMPGDANTCFHLANALHATGQTAEALVYYRKALQRRPGWSFATNNLAWILATHRDASIRDGHESVRLAEALCQAEDQSNPSSLATLAAAYAEVGRFDVAGSTNQRAAELAERQGRTTMAKRLRDRSATFDDRRPVRE